MREEFPGEIGLAKLTLAILGGCAVATLVTGDWFIWVPVLLAIYASWRFAIAVSK